MDKPPIGITPKRIHDLKRINEILDGMKRYSEAKMPIPVEWIMELEQLILE